MGNSESTGVVNFINVQRQKDMYGKKPKEHCPYSSWKARESNSESTGVVNFIKVRRQVI